jgi:O-antigen ligase
MKRITSKQFLFYSTSVLAASLPIFPTWIPLFIAILFLVYLFTKDWKLRIQELLASKSALILLLFFLFNVLGILWSENLEKALMHLEIKLSLLFFPFLIFARPDLNIVSVKRILNFYCLSTTIVATCMLLSSFGNVILNDGILLTYGAFSPIFHPSYLSMYFILAIVLLVDGLKDLPRKYYYVYGLAILFLSSAVFFLASKVNIILLFGLGLFYLLRFLKNRLSRLKQLIVALFFGIAFFIAIFLNQAIFERFLRGFDTVKNIHQIDVNDTESNAARILIWNSALDLISEHPWGVGTGDVNIELTKKYHENGFTGIEYRQLNAHNQFLQTAAAIGILGMISLLFVFLVPMFNSAIQGNFPMLGFLMLTFVNACVEGILEAQAGVVFFAFFYALLLRNVKSS